MMELESVFKQGQMGRKGDHPADEFDSHFKIFHESMRNKVGAILLGSAPYDSCIMEVDARLKIIMKTIHKSCLEAAAQYGVPGNYVRGANSAGFNKVVEAMMDQGLV